MQHSTLRQPRATANQCQHEEGTYYGVNAKVSIIYQWHPMGFADQDGTL